MENTVVVAVLADASALSKLGLSEDFVRSAGVQAPAGVAEALKGVFGEVPAALRKAAEAMEKVG